jgi:hypothetical protein
MAISGGRGLPLASVRPLGVSPEIVSGTRTKCDLDVKRNSEVPRRRAPLDATLQGNDAF